MILHGFLAAALGTAVLLAESDAGMGQGADTRVVNPATLALPVGAPVNVRLPDGSEFEVVVQERRHHPSGNSTWLARPADPALAGYLVTLTGSERGGLSGTVISPHGEFRLTPGDGAWNEVRMMPVTPPDNARQDDVVWHAPGASRGMPTPFDDVLSGAPLTTLNVLVLYTAAARAGRSEAEWTAYLDNLFAVTNEAYAVSGTQVAFQRTDERLVVASESLSSSEVLAQLHDPDLYGEVAGWRLAADAHLVALLRSWQPSQLNCGAAHVPACGDDAQCYSAGIGYSVTSLGDCTELMLAHELGHNLGAAHEPGLDFGGTYPYAHAHVTPAGVGTVMSRTGSTLAARFSSPELDCDGHPCGIEEVSDNVRALRQSRHYIARWITDRSITLFDFSPSRVTRGGSLLLNFLWFGVLTPRFDIDLYRDGAPVANLALGESLPWGFKLLSIPASLPLGTGYSLRVTAADLPAVFVESASFEIVEPTGPPSVITLDTAAVTAPAGATSVMLSVQRSGGTEGTVIVEFETRDGSAQAGTHYTATSGSFAWSDGTDDAFNITVPLVAGAARGQDRTFSVALSSVSSGAVLGTPAVAVVTITAQPRSGGGGGAFGVFWLMLAGALRVLAGVRPVAER
jgi:hypothetical protein